MRCRGELAKLLSMRLGLGSLKAGGNEHAAFTSRMDAVSANLQQPPPTRCGCSQGGRRATGDERQHQTRKEKSEKQPATRKKGSCRRRERAAWQRAGGLDGGTATHERQGPSYGSG